MPAADHAAAAADARAPQRSGAAEVRVDAVLLAEVDADRRPVERVADTHAACDLAHDVLRRGLERSLDDAEHPARELVVGGELLPPVGDLRPLRVVEERVERLVQRVRVDERAAADAGAGEHQQVVEHAQPLDPAQPQPRHEQEAAQIPVRPGEVVRAKPAPRLEHGDAVALLRQPERGDAAAEAAADHEHVDVVRRHASIVRRAAASRYAGRPVRRLLPALAALALAAPAAAATIHGTARGDTIVGTPAADTIAAGAGARFRAGGVRRRRPRRLRRRSGRRQRRPRRPRRRELRGRLTATLRRSVDEPEQPARDGRRARQLLLGIDRRRRVPGRPLQQRRRIRHRRRGLHGCGANVDANTAAVGDRRLEPARTGVRRLRPDRRVRRRSRRLARRHADARGDDQLARLRGPLDGRAALVGAGHGRDRPDPRQGLDRVRQQQREPLPRPLLRRVHGRPEEHHRQRVERRRRPDLVGPGEGGDDARRHAARDPPERDARRRRGGLLGRGCADGLDRRGPLHRRRRDVLALDGGAADRGAERRDARGLASVGRRRLGRDDLRRLARLPLPSRVQGERHGPSRRPPTA